MAEEVHTADGSGAGNAVAGDNGAGDNTDSQDTTNGANGSVANGSDRDPFEGLDKDTRDWVDRRYEGSVAELAKQARQMDRQLGGMVRVPDDGADQSEWDQFFKRVGSGASERIRDLNAPDAADKYDFEVPEDLPETIPYDGDLDKRFATAALEHKLTKDQAHALRDLYFDHIRGVGEQMNDQLKSEVSNRVEAAKEKLTDMWGPMDGERFRANVELADRAFQAVDTNGDLRETFERLGILGPDKEIFEPSIATAFSNLGSTFFTEDAAVRGDPASIGNPFEAGSTFNLTQAMQIAKTDPDRAMQLCAAAGADPTRFGLSRG